MSSEPTERLRVRVHRRTTEATDIVRLDLRSVTGEPLPTFAPGAHVDVHLSNGLVRQYSLLSDCEVLDHYEIGVSKSPTSRGGSSCVHQTLHEGEIVEISYPRNNFRLKLGADRYLLIAGGIGITPILAMARFCQQNGLDWQLIYLSRSRSNAAFCQEVLDLDPKRVHFHFDDEQGRLFDINSAELQVADGTAIYCCGPDPLMKAVAKFAEGRPAISANFEWFSPPKDPTPHAPDAAFQVQLGAGGPVVQVPENKSILEVLEANGLELPCSCREGMCRTCETTVLQGVPDHRDYVLSDEERDEGRSIIICVSRSKTPLLVLDI